MYRNPIRSAHRANGLSLAATLALVGCEAAVLDKSGSGSRDDGGRNTPPTAPTVAITPNPATTTDDLRVVVVGEASDFDGDPVTYRYVWFADGALRPELTGSSLPADQTTKGQTWTVNVVATDGSADGGVGVASVAVVNSPPTAAVALPGTIASDSDIVAVPTLFDADGDIVQATYAWTSNGVPTPWTEPTVPASATSRGETWSVHVTTNDGIEAGETALAAVLVVNSPPALSMLDIAPDVVFTDDTLAVAVTAVDADGDMIDLRYSWSVNGTPLSVEGPSLAGSSHFDKGDVVQVTVSASDAESAGSSLSSDPILVENSVPTAPLIAIRPSVPAASDSLVCSVLAPATDADGDAIAYSFEWEVDGVRYTDAVDDIYVGDGVPSGETFDGQSWTCTVEATDGAGRSPTVEASVLIGGSCGDGTVTHTVGGVELIAVCAGAFDMGCTAGQAPCQSDESPVHAVTLSRDYIIGRTEVSQDQFYSVMGYDPSIDTACGGDCPVENVTWHEAAAFTNALSALDGFPACYSCTGSGPSLSCAAVAVPYDCEGYRLPTEAEWEAAARCGEDLPYAGGLASYDVGWTYSGSYSKHEVATKLANLCGTFDMTGNVFEWTSDRFGPYSASAQTDPVGARVGTQVVTRGGSFATPDNGCRVAFRYERYFSDHDAYTGFRVARTRH